MVSIHLVEVYGVEQQWGLPCVLHAVTTPHPMVRPDVAPKQAEANTQD